MLSVCTPTSLSVHSFSDGEPYFLSDGQLHDGGLNDGCWISNNAVVTTGKNLDLYDSLFLLSYFLFL
jgi:hypothetical protein